MAKGDKAKKAKKTGRAVTGLAKYFGGMAGSAAGKLAGRQAALDAAERAAMANETEEEKRARQRETMGKRMKANY